MANANTEKIPKRILGSLLSAVSAGVVPRSGAPYIAIGRVDEIESLTDDLSRVSDGEGVTRFIIGRYGSGKSFLIQLMRTYAMERGFVTADCDLSPERRLYGAGGLNTYRELIRNLSCRSAPDGGALTAVIGRLYSTVTEGLASEGRLPSDEDFSSLLTARIIKETRELEGQVGGFDFALVVSEYCRAWGDGDDAKASACLRWLRGEYANKTEARRELGLRAVSVIDDSNWYEHVKLICALVRRVGYSGLCVFIDEGVNLYKISNRISREANYEKILSMYNDTMQGKADGMMLVFGGTPQFLEDTRRGLFSYEALRSRLCDGRFKEAAEAKGLRSTLGPVIRLRRLGDAELLALMMRISSLHERYYGWKSRISDGETADFLKIALSRSGADSMVTPREIIRDFVTLLDLLYQNPGKTYEDVVSKDSSDLSKNPDTESMPVSEPKVLDSRSAAETKSSAENSARRITIDDIVF